MNSDLIRRRDVLALAKDVTLQNGCKHRCIDATMIHELPSAEPNLQPNLQSTCNQLATDCISRKEAIDAIDGLPNCYNGFSDSYDKAYIIGVLEELPSAEKTGKWIQHPIYEGSDHYYYACSECDYRSWSQDNYCSVCGARMEVEND